MIVLGLDPGTIRIGYGFIEVRGNKLVHLASGLLKIPPAKEGNGLAAAEEDLSRLLALWRPEWAGVERLFFSKNQKTGLAVAETRGVLLNTLHKNGVPVIEIAPSEVKSAVAGHGRADKKAVAKMVDFFLGLSHQKTLDDVSDALAIAIAVSRRRPQKAH
ncbi:MAG: Crossover junction endodeoxyribonuclease RuvC [Candidatus Jorgensenbacteria bacterium GW2011_GWB1_49_9]|nr:MAG: Crossover junction endodeoxyribonuclease RuvC [Candidatus Jorgensenbacteria bacterium GW2011_GWB1_49_9]